jgi:hypothetical protein
MIDILLYTHSDVRKTKNKTLNNYPLKKFHLNSFMNVVRLSTILHFIFQTNF